MIASRQTPSAARYCLRLAKEDFKFSSAHFTLFDEQRAERMHGHNYQVAVLLEGSRLDAEGLLADFEQVKGAIRALCDSLDSMTLIPEHSPHLRIAQEGDAVEVQYRERRYVLPSDDVLILPMVNTSIECLAAWIWDQLAPVLAGTLVHRLGISVGETAGQSCIYEADLNLG